MSAVVTTGMRVDAFTAWIEQAQRAYEQAALKALARTAELAAAYAKQSTLYRSHTYGLRNSITWRVFGGFGGVPTAGGGLSAQVKASAPYAKFVEDGTQAHWIFPRRKKWLRFEQNGAIRFSKGVYHPGTAPRPFMQQARDRAEPLLERLLSEAFVRAFA